MKHAIRKSIFEATLHVLFAWKMDLSAHENTIKCKELKKKIHNTIMLLNELKHL